MIFFSRDSLTARLYLSQPQGVATNISDKSYPYYTKKQNNSAFCVKKMKENPVINQSIINYCKLYLAMSYKKFTFAVRKKTFERVRLKY